MEEKSREVRGCEQDVCSNDVATEVPDCCESKQIDYWTSAPDQHPTEHSPSSGHRFHIPLSGCRSSRMHVKYPSRSSGRIVVGLAAYISSGKVFEVDLTVNHFVERRSDLLQLALAVRNIRIGRGTMVH